MSDAKQVILPYLNVEYVASLFMANTEQQFKLVAKAVEGYDTVDPPEGSPWAEAPLSLWCWHVLTINGLDPDPQEHHNLLHWGIDMEWASPDIHRFVWVIA